LKIQPQPCLNRLIYLLILSCLALSCKQLSNDQKAPSEPGSRINTGPELGVMASEFPAEKLDNVVTTISQNELNDVVNDGESPNWKRTKLDVTLNEIILQNKTASDNTIKFKLYGRLPSYAVMAVQQVNAQVVTTRVWEYQYKATEDHLDQWNEFLLPEYKLTDFFDDRVILPPEFKAQSAKSYLDYDLAPTAINITFNKWRYMQDMEADSLAPEGPMDPTLVKYMHIFKWNGEGFYEEKLKEPGYNDVLTFTSHVVSPVDGGPGEHEFDCGHTVSVKASSTLPNQGGNTYKPNNVLELSKAWSEGAKGDGVGEWLEFTLTTNYRVGDDWHIGNGYNKTKEVWQANNRVKKFKVLVDDQFVCYVMLSNVSAYQSFNISPYWLKDAPGFKKGTRVKFIIEEVYKGTKYDDTLISYFVPVGNCG